MRKAMSNKEFNSYQLSIEMVPVITFGSCGRVSPCILLCMVQID